MKGLVSRKEAAFITPECNRESFVFQPLGRRQVVGRFDGGKITSDAGALLVLETERITGALRRFVVCFTDHHDSELVSLPKMSSGPFAACKIEVARR